MRSKFSERFKILKQEKHLTFRQISEAIDVTVPNLSYYMKGREPNYDVLMQIANYFDVTVDWLIGNSNYRTAQYQELHYSMQEKLCKDFNCDMVLDGYYSDKIERLKNKMVDVMLGAICNDYINNTIDNYNWLGNIVPITHKFLNAMLAINRLADSEKPNWDEVCSVFCELKGIYAEFFNIVVKKVENCILNEGIRKCDKEKALLTLKKLTIGKIS